MDTLETTGLGDVMDPIQAFVIGVAFALAALNLILLATRPGSSVSRRLFGALMVAVLGYLTTPWVEGTWWIFVTLPVQTAIPGLFWLFNASLFDDHFEMRPWKWALLALTILPPWANRTLNLYWDIDLGLFLVDAPQVLEFALVFMGLAAPVQNWSGDLVQSRRRLRLWFSGFYGLSILTILLFRTILFPSAPWLDTFQYGVAALILLMTNGLLMQLQPGLLTVEAEDSAPRREETTEEPPPAEDDPPTEVLSRLADLMELDCVYREMGLTIGKLAGQLEVPEYRLRKIINRGLGYRNFNDFLNSYRIREVAKRLQDPTQVHLPVLSIAMDEGFRSLSSFNKSFKDHYQLTPTEFRSARLRERAQKV